MLLIVIEPNTDLTQAQCTVSYWMVKRGTVFNGDFNDADRGTVFGDDFNDADRGTVFGGNFNDGEMGTVFGGDFSDAECLVLL